MSGSYNKILTVSTRKILLFVKAFIVSSIFLPCVALPSTSVLVTDYLREALVGCWVMGCERFRRGSAHCAHDLGREDLASIPRSTAFIL